MFTGFLGLGYVRLAIGTVEPSLLHSAKGETIVLAVINDTGILVVLVGVILLFGASQIPKLARNLGEASREFRKAHEDATPIDHGADQLTLSRRQLENLLASAAQTNQADADRAPATIANPPLNPGT
jgi:sec-independent protein translocase protein TatA